MSEQEIIKNGQFLVECLQVLGDFASEATKATGQELDPRVLSNYTEQIGLVLCEIQSIRDRLRSRQVDITQRETELDGREQEVEDLRRRAENCELELSKARSAVQKLEAERAAGQSDRDTLMSSLQSAIDKVQPVVSRESEIARREQAAGEALRKNTELVARNTAIQAGLDQEMQEAIRAKQARQDADARYLQDQAALEQQKKQLEHTSRPLEQDRTKLEQDRSRFEQESKAATEFRAGLNQAQRLLGTVKAEADTAKAVADTAKAEADSVKAEADSAKAVADSAKAEADSLKAEADSLKAEADKTLQDARHQKSASEQLNRESDSRRALVDRMFSDISEQGKTMSSLLAKISEKDARADREHTELSSLLEKSKDLAARLEEDRSEAANTAGSDKNELTETLERARGVLRETKKADDLAAAASVLRQANCILDASKGSAGKRIHVVEQERDELRTERDRLKGEAEVQKIESCLLTAESQNRLKALEESRERIKELEASKVALRDRADREAARTDRQMRALLVSNTWHISNSERKTEHFLQQVQRIRDSNDSLQGRLDRKAAEFQSKQDELTNVRRDRDDLEHQVRRANQASDEAQEEAEGLRRRSAAVAAELAALQGQARTLESRARSSDKRYETRLDQDFKTLTKAYEGLQVHDKSRELEEELRGRDRDLQDMREECKRLRTDRANRELESRQGDQAGRGRHPADARAERSPWEVTVDSLFRYLEGLRPVSSGGGGPGFKAADDERLLRALGKFLVKEERRDRFTVFLEAGCRPDQWYCIAHIFSSRHAGLTPLGGRCLTHDDCRDCLLHVRHLDASSGGRTLDFRVPIPDEEDEVDEDEEDGGVQLASGTV
jgi:chromosome segregation ATPase